MLTVFLIAELLAQAPATNSVVKVQISEARGLTDWELDGNGGWTVRGQSLVLEKAGVPSGPIRRPAALAIYRGRSLTDFVLQVDVRSTAPVDLAVRDVLLIFGYQSPTQFYYVHLAAKTDAVHNGIFLVDKGDRRRLDDASATARLTDQAWHRIRLERQFTTGTIRVFFGDDPTPLLSTVDRTLGSGRVGVGSFDETAEFRAFDIMALAGAPVGAAQAPLTIDIQDVVAMPITGAADGTGQTNGMLARVNTLQEEPGGARRLFINDMNGPLYILDKETKKLTTYLDFNGRDGRPGIFHRLLFEQGYATGLTFFQFDPAYAANGRFYTVHTENPAIGASNLPDGTHFPGMKSGDFQTTTPIATPGPVLHEAVLLEWTDTIPANAVFEGSVREIMRVQLNTRIHPMGEVTFNPTARRGDPEWRVMYIGVGDSGSGEARRDIRQNPQRLDTMVGKILRIVPDLNEHAATSTVSDNGRYRIPNDNPFAATAGARAEIWAYGFRNPHRLGWAIDPANRANNRLIATSIGQHTWEAAYIVRKGANYGYSLREGNELLKPDNRTAPLPAIDRIPIQIGSTVTDTVVEPTYPVLQYGHGPAGGDAIGGGYVYNGKAIPALRGKFVFTDISTGRVWYADYRQMLAADDGNPGTLAPMHALNIRWNGQVYDTMFPITMVAYHARGGRDPDLPGRATVSGVGRSDVRLGIDAAGELYVCSKTDGMVRGIIAAH